MPKYHSRAIGQDPFLRFVRNPNADQLRQFVELLSDNSQANSFFELKAPVWSHDPLGWVRVRLTDAEWYQDLSEAEMVAWQHASIRILERPEFIAPDGITYPRFGFIDIDVFDIACSATRNSKAQYAKMWPFRFQGLPAEIKGTEPVDRVFWPEHALLEVDQIRTLKDELSDYELLIQDYSPRSPGLFSTVEERRNSAISQSEELVIFLNSLIKHNSMWLALIDC